MFLPENVKYIIKRLEEHGFCAYAVGGCVRDTLLDAKPNDWDICTNALPKDTVNIFSDYTVVKTGIRHGTIMVIIDREPFEITTFRIDGRYYDNRHPDKVTFVNNLKEDLKRRDFTINAMAYNDKTGICDYFGGINDLKNKIIRCVGDPDKRFTEDALRIIRAVRFSAQLGFNIDERTELSIHKNKGLLSGISRERIKNEFVKILMSNDYNVYYKYKDIFLIFTHNICADINFYKIISALPPILSVRLTAFILYGSKYHNKTALIELSKIFLYDLKFDKKTIKHICCLIRNYDINITNDLKILRKILSEIDHNVLYDILTLKIAGAKNDSESLLYKNALNKICYIKENNICTKVSELNINGNDLIEHGLSDGKKTGILLKKILNTLIEEDLENKKEILIKTAIKIARGSEEWN